MDKLDISLSESETRVLSEAFGCLDKYMARLIDSTDCEDKQAYAGNDLIFSRLLAERIQNQSTERFEPNVLIQSYPEKE